MLRNLFAGVVLILPVACGGGSSTAPTAPSSVLSVVQGTVVLGLFQVATVSFNVDRAGILT